MEEYYCELCDSIVHGDDEYCPNCGTIMIDNVNCSVHVSDEAKGICIICRKAFCKKCGDFVNGFFLCYEHEDYEIVQNYARIRGGIDEVQLNFYLSCLEGEGLHPVIFSRKTGPWHPAGFDNLLNWSGGDYKGRMMNELKLMVPCDEVLRAEDIIEEIEREENTG